MPGELGDCNLLHGLRIGREGAAFERVFRGLAYVFYSWSQFSDREMAREEPQRGTLLAIPFDKLGALFVRVWNELFRADRAKVFEAIQKGPVSSDLSGLVTFAPPLEEIVGRHGRGVGRFQGRRPMYLLEILYALQEIEGIKYFDIQAPNEGPGIDEYGPLTRYPYDDDSDVRRLTHRAVHYKTTVRPACPIPDRNLFLSGFSTREQELLDDFALGIRQLSASQIRALGTHSSDKNTAEDIRYEFGKWLPLCEIAGRHLKEYKADMSIASSMEIYATEAFRKSAGNRPDYRAAYEKFLQHARIEMMKDAFGRVQKGETQIWDSGVVIPLVEISMRAFAISEYLHCAAFFTDNHLAGAKPKSRSSVQRFQNKWETCCKNVAQIGIPPIDIPGLCSQDVGSARGIICDHLASLLTLTSALLRNA